MGWRDSLWLTMVGFAETGFGRVVSLFVVCVCAGAPSMVAQQTPASILAQVRAATGGDAWDRVAELRLEGTLQVTGKSGPLVAEVDLRSGANADRVVLEGVGQVENHADTPTQNWETDAAGNVLLSPGGKEPGDVDDLYVHRNGWWQPGFGGAAITLLAPQTLEGVTYDRLEVKVPGGGAGFTLWVDREHHTINRRVSGDSATVYSDFRHTEGGLTLPFREQKGSDANAVVVTTTKVAALPELKRSDFEPPFRTDYTMPASGQVTVHADGGVMLPMKVNGQGPFSTIFDTGGVNGMSVAFAKRLGLKVEEAPVNFGAIGGAIKVHMAHVDTLTIGDLVVRDQMFYVLDLPSGANDPELMVGWELMRLFAVRTEVEHNQITFFDGPSFHYAGTASAVPLTLNKNGNGAEVRAEADGIFGMFTVDSGNQIGLFFTSSFVQDHHLVEALGARYRGYNGRGFGGPSPEAWFARLHTLRIGDIVVDAPVVRLQTASDGMYANGGNIGQSILNRFTITYDCMRGVMYLDKTADWNRREVFNRAGLVIDPDEGVDTVETVFAGSPGEAAGLKSGDSITAIDGKPPADDPNDPAFNQPVGTVLHLTVRRGGVVRLYEVTLKDVL